MTRASTPGSGEKSAPWRNSTGVTGRTCVRLVRATRRASAETSVAMTRSNRPSVSNASAIAVLNTAALLPVYVDDVAAFSTPIGVASNPNSALAYAAAKGSNVVQYLNYAVWPILTPYAPAVAGTEPYGIAVDRTGSRVLTTGIGTPAAPNNGRLSVFEASTGQLQWSLRLGFNRALFGDFVIEEIDLPLLVDGFEE